MKNNKLPIISTKTGDKGETSLWSGQRVPKNHPAIKCVCEIDLFDSSMGLLHDLIQHSNVYGVIIDIQFDLVYLKGEIATHPRDWNKYRKNNKYISQSNVKYLDKKCDEIKTKLENKEYKISGWVIYGGEGRISAHFDYIRSLCRKVEIEIYNLDDKIKDENISESIKQYINRLSDYLYLLARYFSKN